MKKINLENKNTENKLRRGAAVLLAGCMLACALAACGDKKDSSSSGASPEPSISPVATPNPTPAPAAKAVRVTGDEVNVRKGSSTDSDILGTVEEGDKLALLSETKQGDWYNVQFEGAGAYIYADFVEVIDVTAEDYGRMMAPPAATPQPTQDPDATLDPDATPNPDASQAGEGSTPSSSVDADNEDGE